ncbi:SAM-dependent methyltransferase [Williamsia phyllosphaerae]|uniref:SAM-dependent methyltransferase n=1 Tax=Williamsia phyllosphaerae TaxID=885042 RepID=UPI001E5FF00D|nr:cyclopropane-fatty-acyl-phospholipid synthase family protein [Williamsia phyllosphaerae]
MQTQTGSDRARVATDAVRHHYDVGNEFFGLWLDETLSYSCALRAGGSDTLADAQIRKLDHHLHAVDADRAHRLLDIGCGWGAVLRRAVEGHGVGRAVGLTLSAEQAAHITDRGDPAIEVRTESWTQHAPTEPYDAIISIGAFEHFADPTDPPEAKIAVYRDFFDHCRRWLNPGGTLSLQTIVYATMSPDAASTFMQQEIFPNAELPTFAEIAAAAEGLFEITAVDNGREDYAWTCGTWAARLRENRTRATELVGADTVARYQRYLTQSALGFRMGKIGLYRIALRPYPDTHFGSRRTSRP